MRFLFCFGLLWLSACSSQLPVGPISPATLRASAPVFDRQEAVPADDISALQATLARHGPAELVVFFGDWCHDSIEEVPRLLSLVDSQAEGSLQVSLINLDHDKRDPAGRAKAAAITRTPTIIVRRNGVELGRIVERPQTTLVGDLIRLLQSGS